MKKFTKKPLGANKAHTYGLYMVFFIISMNIIWWELIQYHRHAGPAADANCSCCDSELSYNLEKFAGFGGTSVYSSKVNSLSLCRSKQFTEDWG